MGVFTYVKKKKFRPVSPPLKILQPANFFFRALYAPDYSAEFEPLTPRFAVWEFSNIFTVVDGSKWHRCLQKP